jgi:hypothetical protein
VYTQRNALEIQTPTQWNLISVAYCVIAQQYSSATIVSLRFHPHEEKIQKFYYLNCHVFKIALSRGVPIGGCIYA